MINMGMKLLTKLFEFVCKALKIIIVYVMNCDEFGVFYTSFSSVLICHLQVQI